MNILNRRMFANGDVANANQAPSKMIDVPNLINYYVSQGFNSVEIKEMLPEVPMAVIESTVNSLGGSVNPAVASPGADEFSGNINPFVEVPETRTLVNEQGDTTINPSFPEPVTPPELPSEADISMIPEEIRSYMEATAGLFDDNGMVTAIMFNFGLSEEEARRIVGMSPKPDTTITLTDPSMERVSTTATEDDLPDVASVGMTNNLQANQYRTSDGIVHEIDPTKFAEMLKTENDRIITGLLLNPNVEYGANLAAIVENVAKGRSTTLTSEENIRVGADPSTIVSVGGELDTAAKYGIDFAKEGIEGMYNLLKKPFVDPTFRGILFGRDAEKRAIEQGLGEYEDIFPTAIGGPASNMNPNVYASTGGELPSTLDDIVLSSSLGTVEQSLEEIAKEEAEAVEEAPAEEAPAEEDAEVTSADPAKSADPVKAAEPGDDKKDEDKKDADLPQGMTVATENDQAEQLFTTLGNAFNSDANLRLMRNVGKALTQYGNFAEGIGIGTAAASEERQLQEQLDAKRDAELAEKLAESGKLEFGDKEKLVKSKEKLNDYIKDYNNAIAAEELTTSILGILFDPSQNITSFISKIGTTVDEFLNFAELKNVREFENLKPGQRAKAMLKVLTNRDIKEILGESGRTISNIDRQIAEKIMGSLRLFDPEDNVGTMRFKLEQNLDSVLNKKSLAQRNIKANATFIADYDPLYIFDDIELLTILNEELGANLQRRASATTTSPSSNPDDIQIDISDQQ